MDDSEIVPKIQSGRNKKGNKVGSDSGQYNQGFTGIGERKGFTINNQLIYPVEG